MVPPALVVEKRKSIGKSIRPFKTISANKRLEGKEVAILNSD